MPTSFELSPLRVAEFINASKSFKAYAPRVGAIIDFFRRGTLRRQAVWTRVANERGGNHIIPKWYKFGKERIEVVVQGASIVVDIVEESTGNSTVSYTRCVAPSIVGTLPNFRIYRERKLSAIGKMLGAQDVTLGGDPDFDKLYMVKTKDAAGTRELWTENAMVRMRHQLAYASVDSDGEEIHLVEVGKYKEAAKLNAALDLVSHLASTDVFGVAALRALAGPGLQCDRFGYPRVELQAPEPVVIETREISGRLASVAMLKEAADWQPVVAIIEGGSLVDAKSFQQFSPLARAQVANVGDATLVVEAGSAPSLQWSGVEHDTERLMAGAQLLGALAGIGEQRL